MTDDTAPRLALTVALHQLRFVAHEIDTLASNPATMCQRSRMLLMKYAEHCRKTALTLEARVRECEDPLPTKADIDAITSPTEQPTGWLRDWS